jgi:hypothetical protein
VPLVFVHGVNNRKEDPGYESGRALTEKLFQKYLAGAVLNGKKLQTVAPRFPYWGDLATTFAWNMASLPSGEINSLGAAGIADDLRPLIAFIDDSLADASTAANQPLLTLARKSFPQAVQLLTDLLLQNPTPGAAATDAEFIVQAQGYAAANPAPTWLAAVTSDEQFYNRLIAEVSATHVAGAAQALGVFSGVTNAVAKGAAKLKAAVKSASATVLDKSGDFASTKLLAWGRHSLNAVLGRFFGDIFAYLDGRGDKSAPGLIPQRILKDFDDAIAAGPPGEPLIIVGHSLGGVISYDLLSYFRPDIQVDLFVSVGSQVSHFEEIKRFKVSDPAVPSAAHPLATTPQNIAQWINIFDEVDIFAYACDKVFDRVHDFRYDTQTYTIKAHSAYLWQSRWYERLRARIDQL